ncbi:unnamed protein product, partial [Sphagnum balticum]
MTGRQQSAGISGSGRQQGAGISGSGRQQSAGMSGSWQSARMIGSGRQQSARMIGRQQSKPWRRWHPHCGFNCSTLPTARPCCLCCLCWILDRHHPRPVQPLQLYTVLSIPAPATDLQRSASLLQL